MAKILVVDDDAGVRDVFARVLKQAGYEVITAVNGQDGLEKAYLEKPDLIIWDFGMPIMQGPVAAKAVQGAGIDVPMILISAQADQAMWELCKSTYADRFDAFVAKPVIPLSLLIDEITRLLQEKSER